MRIFPFMFNTFASIAAAATYLSNTTGNIFRLSRTIIITATVLLFIFSFPHTATDACLLMLVLCGVVTDFWVWWNFVYEIRFELNWKQEEKKWQKVFERREKNRKFWKVIEQRTIGKTKRENCIKWTLSRASQRELAERREKEIK